MIFGFLGCKEGHEGRSFRKITVLCWFLNWKDSPRREMMESGFLQNARSTELLFNFSFQISLQLLRT